MIIYKDRLTGDEIFSDSYKQKVVDDLYYEVEGKLTTETSNVDDAAIGANPSAEEEVEASAASSVSGVNIVLAHRLKETSFSKKDYQTHIKAFMKKLVEKLDPERAACVKSKMPEVIKKIMGRFKEYEFFTGESMDPEGLVVLLDYREDGRTPFLIVFKDAVVEEKF